ncbi:MAG TPA: hypothetical protein VJN64_13050, partial [Terriglobales bacterium]|nr:hypothetical protein [Terriglobales bacterium]
LNERAIINLRDGFSCGRVVEGGGCRDRVLGSGHPLSGHLEAKYLLLTILGTGLGFQEINKSAA